MQAKPPSLVRYADLSGASGVVAYAILADSIRVRFAGGKTYEYTNQRPGADHVARMKQLALAGRGLGTYISQHVRENYARRV